MTQLHEWGLGGRQFGTLITWFLVGGDFYTAYTVIAVPAAVFGNGASGFFALPYTIIVYPFVFMVMPRLWRICHRENYITSADVSPDNLTITFHLKQAFAPFLAIWTDGGNAPMPAHIFSSMAPDKILNSSENLSPSVSSGPFKVTESKPGASYTVSRNSNYFQAAQGLPYLDKVVFRIVTDQNTILKDLQAGTIDSSWFLDVTKTIAYKALTNYKLSANPHASNFEAIYFDFHNKVLADNVDVRKAIAMAIDHQALIDTARRGEAVPLCTDHGQAYVPGYQADAPCPKFDPAGAKAMLQADGWVLGSDNVFSKNGQRLEFMPRR